MRGTSLILFILSAHYSSPRTSDLPSAQRIFFLLHLTISQFQIHTYVPTSRLNGNVTETYTMNNTFNTPSPKIYRQNREKRGNLKCLFCLVWHIIFKRHRRVKNSVEISRNRSEQQLRSKGASEDNAVHGEKIKLHVLIFQKCGVW